jgi:uncharacterized surface protein with fasciclin (FAS1) repeats
LNLRQALDFRFNFESADEISANAMVSRSESSTESFNGGKVSIDGAKVVKTDIETSNSIIHVIDAVILPK